jgi:hypothetical protein
MLTRKRGDQGTSAFGSVGLTVLKDSKVFGAPLGDTGHANDFIAIGGISHEAADGKRVGEELNFLFTRKQHNRLGVLDGETVQLD